MPDSLSHGKRRIDIDRSLRHSQECYRQVVEHLGEGMFVVQNEHIVFANRQASEILRIAPQDLLGADPVAWIHPDDQPQVRALRTQLRERPDSASAMEMRHIGQDGVVRWLSVRPRVVPWEGEHATLTFFSEITERKAMAQALQRSEERYRAVMDHMDSGLVVWQGQRYVYANRQAVEILRMSAPELLEQEFLAHVHPQDRTLVLECRARRLAGQEAPTRHEVRWLHQDGSVCWLDLGFSVVPWDGEAAIITFFVDVTERHTITEALHRSEERYRHVVEHSGEGMLVVQDGRFVFVNGRAAELVQMDIQDMMREGYLHRIHPDDRALVDERRRRRLVGEEVPNRYEIRIVWPDGQVRWLDIGVTVVPWDGAPATLTFFSDVTERRLADEALRRSWAEREAILNNTLVGMALTVERKIQWANRRFGDMLGYTVADLLGHDGRRLYQDEGRWAAQGREQYAALRERGTYSDERQLRRSDGTFLWVQLDGQCVQSHAPDAGVIWTLLDITARIQAETQMRLALAQQRELNELRARFVAMTSHEFRTPLATILSSAELLRFYGERLPQQERFEVLRTIEDGVHRMAHMLDRVLLLGRAEAKMLEFRPAPTDLHGLCQALVEELQPQLLGTRCTMDAQWEDLPTRAAVDEKLLRHIFSNLLSNAVKYSPGGGVVRFRAQMQAPHTLVFTVSDQGIGIPPHELPHLFQSFHRASNVGAIMGTGLGLAIVKSAVDLHGGQITVHSAPMQGSCFTVTLPVSSESAAE